MVWFCKLLTCFSFQWIHQFFSASTLVRAGTKQVASFKIWPAQSLTSSCWISMAEYWPICPFRHCYEHRNGDKLKWLNWFNWSPLASDKANKEPMKPHKQVPNNEESNLTFCTLLWNKQITGSGSMSTLCVNRETTLCCTWLWGNLRSINSYMSIEANRELSGGSTSLPFFMVLRCCVWQFFYGDLVWKGNEKRRTQMSLHHSSSDVCI